MRKHAVALVALAAATAAAAWIRREPPTWLPPVVSPPERLGRWIAEVGAPEDVLPEDPRSLLTFRRTYRQGRRTVWIAVSYYPFFGTPERRPDVTLIAPSTAVAVHAQADPKRLSNGRPRPMPPVNLIALTRGSSSLHLAYWYQLGPHAFRSEYALRLRLLWESTIGRPQPLVLVRAASLTLDDLRDFFDAAPTLVGSLSGS